MSNLPFQKFVDLIAFDQELNALEEQAFQVKKDIDELKEHKGLTADAVKKASEHLHNMRKEVDLHELEMKELDEKIAQKKEKLNQATNSRMYDSILKELSLIQQEQHDLEQVLLSAWNKVESAVADHTQAQEELKEKGDEFDGLIAKEEEKLRAIKQEIDEHHKLRAEKERDIPEEWLEKYSSMRSRVSDPVVPVQQNSCSACFYHLTQQDLISLRKRKLIQCKGCYRFLYLEEAPQKVHEKPAEASQE